MIKKRSFKQDPHARREADKYENPIPSREFITELLNQAPGPLDFDQIAFSLSLTSDENREALRRRLIAMSRDGQLISNRRGGYAVVNKVDLVRGRVQGHKDGYGFLIPAEGGEDIYLYNRQMRKVFDGDEVLVRISGTDSRGRTEGVIVEVLAHNTHQVVGRLVRDQSVAFVRPENPRILHEILVPAEDQKGAADGQIVVVEITQQPGSRQMVQGRVIEVLGNHMAPGMEIDVAIRAHGIPHMWPGAVRKEAEQLPAEVAEPDKLHRVDVRKMPFVTIDGEDARDFDDAVYCEPKRSGGWRLFVAIADVSHYVKVGSALDKEAVVRGNSVYFPDHVVPMLPEALSNGLCSLNPKVDRLCMVCEMTISSTGKISGYKFYEGVMHSHARLTYTQVGAAIEAATGGKDTRSLGRKMLDGLLGRAPSVSGVPGKLMPQILELHKLYLTLREARDERGAIDFETVETRIVFNRERKIDKIVPVVRNDAHKLIEECMLAANVCAARFLEKHEVPGLYRVHKGPADQKLDNLREFLGELGLDLPGIGTPTPKDYQSVLTQIAGRPDAHIIQMVMLRSLSQAVYQPDNEGHFGLGYKEYGHFTSPIRRYPDLLMHRAIRSVIRSKRDTKLVERVKGAGEIAKRDIYPYDFNDLLVLGEGCSQTERRADEATRDVMTWLKCEYLQDHVGDEFEGVVSGVTGFGLFVELKELYTDGLVHVTSLPHDYYHYDAPHHRLVGERSRTVFQLGDELKVQVARVDLDERKVDFELVEVLSSRRLSVTKKAAKGIRQTVKKQARAKAEADRDPKPAKGKRAASKGGPRGDGKATASRKGATSAKKAPRKRK
ncbi:ribonuclease R [Simiduia agarivorans]|uniref:Ribonuclease R n=1 Tax=Simiduia agarivorans (strain DSM 21679 / JCM 13881 / BCRC 17597 / SA1) TaxID=1117647 RepID=K4KLZ0_SIMAS|nr:ribonuclease R [Simiduia agarivorans]AFU99230.1 putative ribonuclease R [Simiduia agarivorans SA1 = DSM 21679]